MSIKKVFVSGVFYVGLAKYSNMLIQLLITAVLARILTPEDYGIITIAIVFMTFFTMLADMGVGPAIIQNQELDETDYKNIHSFTYYLGLIVAFIFALSSPLISHIYGEEKLKVIFLIMCIPIFFTCCQIVPLNLLYKKKEFKYIAVVSTIANFVAGVCAIIYAKLVGGAITLIIPQLLSSILLFIIYKIKEPIRFVPRFSIQSVKKIFSFSAYQFLFNFINYFSRNLDNLLIGKYLGMNALGYYEKSYKLMLMPVRSVSSVISPVVLPIFSEFQSQVGLVKARYLKMLSFVSIISFPLSVFLFFSGKEIMLLLFGSQWGDSVLPFKILSLSLGFQLLSSTTGPIFQSIGKTREMFISQVIITIQMVSLFLLAIFVFKTIEAVSFAFVLEELIAFVVVFWFLLPLIDASFMDLIGCLRSAALLSIIEIIIFMLMSKYVYVSSLLVSLIIKILIAIVLTFLGIQVLGIYDLRYFLKKGFKE